MAHRRKTSSVGRALTWCVVGGVFAFGVWQFLHLRPEFMEELRRASPARGGGPATMEGNVPEDPVAAETEPGVGDIAPTTGEGDGTGLVAETMAATEPGAAEKHAARTGDVGTLLAQAEADLDKADLVGRRKHLAEALALLAPDVDDPDPGPEDPRAGEIRRQLAAMNAPVFLGPDILVEDPLAPLVEIAAGDTFQVLAKRYRITTELVAALNPGLSSNRLRIGGAVKVVRGPFQLRLAKRAGRLDLYAKDMYVRSYAVTLEEGVALPAGPYRLRVYGKTMAPPAKGTGRGRYWLSFEGTGVGTRQVTFAWLYGSAQPRGTDPGRTFSGVRLADGDLVQVHNLLLETVSGLQVAP